MGKSDRSFEKARKSGQKRSHDDDGERTDHDRKHKKPKRVNGDVRDSTTTKKAQKGLKNGPFKSDEFVADSDFSNDEVQPTPREEVPAMPKETAKKHKGINGGTDRIAQALAAVNIREAPETHKKEKKKKQADLGNGNVEPAVDTERRTRDSGKSKKKHKQVNGSVDEYSHPAVVPEAPNETPPKTKPKKDKHQSAKAVVEVQLSEETPETRLKKEKKRLREHKPADLVREDATEITDRQRGGLDDSDGGEKRKKEKKKSKKPREDSTNGTGILEVPVEASAEAANDDVTELAKGSKKRKKQHHKEAEDEAEDATNSAVVGDAPVPKRKKPKNTGEAKKPTSDDELATQPERDNEPPNDDTAIAKAAKMERRKKRKERHQAAQALADGNLMDVDVPAPKPAKQHGLQLQPLDAPEDPEYPFFSQNMSLWLPLFPIGFDEPVAGMVDQHLAPLKNHYSTLIGGVLLDYSNVAVGDTPGRAREGATDSQPTLLTAVDEYAVGYGWLTFTASLFIPSRGAFMEGRLILQSEGHIGVVCWDKFNASIEAKRLPKGWKYIDLTKRAEAAANSKTTAPPTHAIPEVEDDPFADEESAAVPQMHSTGYWINIAGRRIKDTLRFRIKGFDVGLAGDNGYLSIEGTMLTLEEERELLAEEIEVERQRKLRLSGHLRREARRVPEFSVTQFGREDEEEDSGKRVEVYQGSRPMTPDD